MQHMNFFKTKNSSITLLNLEKIRINTLYKLSQLFSLNHRLDIFINFAKVENMVCFNL